VNTVSFRAALVASCAWSAAGCGAKHDSAPVDPPLPAAQLEVVDDAGASTVAIGQALAVGDALLDFGTAIDSKQETHVIVDAVRTRALSAVAACNGVKTSSPPTRHGVVSPVFFFDFGAGCTLPNGLAVSGEVALAVAKSGPSSVDLPMDFTKLKVAGRQLDGALWYCTEGGKKFNVPAVLAIGDAYDNYQVTVTAQADRFTIDGTLSSLRDGANVSAFYQGLTWRPGDCYPSAGTMTVATRESRLEVRFAETSSANGAVTIASGAHVEAHTLPAYGTCPKH
jgi:hypothetical protein